mgnify:CR=1 FL=1|tara:strand:- start:7430 stop:8479 length:1050 start_codon:yes stop_codon:yes gene_type:complete
MYTIIFVIVLMLSAFGILSKKKFPFHIISVILIVFAGFRGVDVGRDTHYYHDAFDAIVNNGKVYINEWGYIYFIKFINFIGGTQQMVLLICSAITIKGISKFILRYSNNIYISILIFFCVGPFYLATFNQVRQYLAIGLFLGYALPLIQQSRFIPYLIWIFLISFFAHLSAVILIPVYFVLNRTYSILFKLVIILISLFTVKVLVFIIQLTPYSYFITRRSDIEFEATLVILEVIIAFFILFFDYFNQKKNSYDLTIFFNMSFISLILLMLIIINENLPFEIFLRLNNYFFPFMLILIPSLLNYFQFKIRNLFSFLLVFMLSLYYWRSAILLGELYDLAPYSSNFNLIN